MSTPSDHSGCQGIAYACRHDLKPIDHQLAQRCDCNKVARPTGIRQHDQLEEAAQVTGPQMQVQERKSSKTPKHGHKQEFCTQSKAQIPKLQLRAKSRCIVCGQHANMAISSHSSMTQARSKCYTPWFALALEPKWQHVNKWYTHIDQARPDICRQTTYLRSGKARLTYTTLGS